MSEAVAFVASVVPFPRRAATRQAETAALLDVVGAAGSIEIVPRAFAARDAAAALHLMGFVHLDEIQPDGRPRRLSAHEASSAASFLNWRITRAAGR
ncbi:MAG: hypothetical protein HEQ16_16550 [Bosea sp.]|jgi:hypothetical protein|nr:hypothetical protein [Bosea sp. (in: a-proteobacteria)]